MSITPIAALIEMELVIEQQIVPAHEKLPHRILLFYANRRPGDATFLEDFRDLARENPNFTFIPTMTQMGRSHRLWTGMTGHIDRESCARRRSVLCRCGSQRRRRA